MVGDTVRRLASPRGQWRDAEGAGAIHHIGTEDLLCTKGEMCAEDLSAETGLLQTVSPADRVRTENHLCTTNHLCTQNHLCTTNYVCTQNHLRTETISVVLPSSHDVRPEECSHHMRSENGRDGSRKRRCTEGPRAKDGRSASAGNTCAGSPSRARSGTAGRTEA